MVLVFPLDQNRQHLCKDTLLQTKQSICDIHKILHMRLQSLKLNGIQEKQINVTEICFQIHKLIVAVLFAATSSTSRKHPKYVNWPVSFVGLTTALTTLTAFLKNKKREKEKN